MGNLYYFLNFLWPFEIIALSSSNFNCPGGVGGWEGRISLHSEFSPNDLIWLLTILRKPMYYIVWFLWISDICQTSLCFSTKVQDYDPYRSWAGSQYGRWELPTSKSKWATWVRISQIYLHWSTWIKVNSGVEAEFKRTPDDGEIKWKRKSSDQCFPLSFDFWPGCYCRKW